MRFSPSGGIEEASWRAARHDTKLLASSDQCDRPTKALMVHSIGPVLSRVLKENRMVPDLPFCTGGTVAHYIESSL